MCLLCNSLSQVLLFACYTLLLDELPHVVVILVQNFGVGVCYQNFVVVVVVFVVVGFE